MLDIALIRRDPERVRDSARRLAVLENYRRADGGIDIPDALAP
jgi:hypothetical protein